MQEALKKSMMKFAEEILWDYSGVLEECLDELLDDGLEVFLKDC